MFAHVLFSITPLPLILKGILTAQDALLAISAGISAIFVSNHGARQVDLVPSSASLRVSLIRQRRLLQKKIFRQLAVKIFFLLLDELDKYLKYLARGYQDNSRH